MLNLRRCAGLEISKEPICAAVSIHHRLAGKDRLTVQDLYGEKFMMMRREWSHYVDLLRDDLWKNHPKIQIVDFDFYDVNAFNQCENNNCVLMGGAQVAVRPSAFENPTRGLELHNSLWPAPFTRSFPCSQAVSKGGAKRNWTGQVITKR